jgi:hypothetical protein
MDKFSNKKPSEDKDKAIQLNTKKEEILPTNMPTNMSVTHVNNISNSISASITSDLLSNIDLNQASLISKKEEKSESKESNKFLNKNTTDANNNTNTITNLPNKNNPLTSNMNKTKYSDKNPLNRLSMPNSREKKLATESIEYEPVFK